MLKFGRHLSLTQRLLAIVAVAVLPAMAGLLYLIIAIHRERAHEVQDMALRSSQIVALEIERIISGSQGLLEAVALTPSVRNGTDRTGCTRYFEALDGRLAQFRGFAVADGTGRIWCSTRGLAAGDSAADTSWFRLARSSGGFVVGEYSGAQPGEVGFLPVALPILDDGRLVAVVAAGIDLNWLGARVRERRIGEGNAVVVADRNGIILAREPASDSFVGSALSSPSRRLLAETSAGTIDAVSVDGTRRIVGFQPPAVTGIGLYVAAGYSTDAAFGPIYASTWRSLVLAGLGALAACLIVWTVGNRLLRQPLVRIVSTINSWRAGDELARTGIAPDGTEISTLAAATDEYMDDVLAGRAARREAEEYRALLLREMSHRIKNVLATVQAIANQTFRNGAGPDSLRAFGQRLAAMAATHDLLVSSNWQSTDLRGALEAVMRPFGLEDGRFELAGPAVAVSARAALALSMATHELCTNAVKYGALSRPGGKVTVRWEVVKTQAGPRFRLRWVESDGPPCAEPTREGFGTRLVRAAFVSEFDATTRLTFPTEGVRFELDADASQILIDGGGGAGTAV